MGPSIIRFLQEGAELLHQQNNILDRLMQYLDDTLMKLNSKLNPDNFSRVLEVMWVKLSFIITRMVDNGIEVSLMQWISLFFWSSLTCTLKYLFSFLSTETKTSELLRKPESDSTGSDQFL